MSLDFARDERLNCPMTTFPVTMEPLVRRLLAPNPSLFTYTGTETYIVGRGEVAV